VPAYGPIPSQPRSPYAPPDALKNPYPFSVKAATNILTTNGWTVKAGGTDTCNRPSGCGVGVPTGTKLAFNLIYSNEPTIEQQVADFAANAKKAGIDITLQPSNITSMFQNYDDAAALNDNAWAMEDFGGFANSTTYPTTYSVFNHLGVSNLGGYDDPQASALITASVSGANPSAVIAEAQYLTQEQPVLFQPVPVSVLVGQPPIAS
jgi:peptide/nickel transport system substrate-binding protein